MGCELEFAVIPRKRLGGRIDAGRTVCGEEKEDRSARKSSDDHFTPAKEESAARATICANR
jgi:hypothetical protein